jgi:hypothetical protein
MLNNNVRKQYINLIFDYTRSAFIISLFWFYFISSNSYTNITWKSILLPEPYPEIQTEKSSAVNFIVNVPILSDQCGYSNLPCSSGNILHLELRGSELANGFKKINR